MHKTIEAIFMNQIKKFQLPMKPRLADQNFQYKLRKAPIHS